MPDHQDKPKWSPNQPSFEGMGSRAMHWESVRAKLDGIASGPQWDNFNRCGQEEFFRTCRCCGAVETFTYRCSLKWCPHCNWRITEERQKKIRAWQLFTTQCKHVVLTKRNTNVFTKKMLGQFIKDLYRLRRSKFWSNVRGGTCSIEITNEERGWHLHAHILADGDWIDGGQLAILWRKILGQDVAIVKVLDAREKDYSRECAKYVVKGSTLAAWPGDEIWQFLNAIRGRRMFFQFGSMLKHKAEVAKILSLEKEKKKGCDCGSFDFVFESQADVVLNQIRKEARRRR